MRVKDQLDIDSVLARYDQGKLVPFIGSGMSIPSAASWAEFVTQLEHAARNRVSADVDLIARAHAALAALRRDSRTDLASVVERALCLKEEVPRKLQQLAEMHWPIVCTTNYDDLWVRALGEKGKRVQVVGRSPSSCRKVLDQFSFPVGQIMWALQGYLGADGERLREELVVGHAEYRTVSHREPHFRRTFAHLFQTRSLLFLGAGLNEPYFRSLFDEVVELTGPPEQPHFALIPEGGVDPGFLRSQYSIVCRTYSVGSDGSHEAVDAFVEELVRAAREERNISSGWSVRAGNPAELQADAGGEFSVVAAPLPSVSRLSSRESFAISCGRGGTIDAPVALASGVGTRAIGGTRLNNWLGDYVVADRLDGQLFGIVARELSRQGDKNAVSRDLRSPLGIRVALNEFLDHVAPRFDVAHVQLLGAGRHRVFHPWVSLATMARGFGEWTRVTRQRGMPVIDMRVYVVDPSVLALLGGGHLDLVREMNDPCLTIKVQAVYAHGDPEITHCVVDRQKTVGDVAASMGLDRNPLVYAEPQLRLESQSGRLSQWQDKPVEDCLVSGSTLTFDFASSE